MRAHAVVINGRTWQFVLGRGEIATCSPSQPEHYDVAVLSIVAMNAKERKEGALAHADVNTMTTGEARSASNEISRYRRRRSNAGEFIAGM